MSRAPDLAARLSALQDAVHAADGVLGPDVLASATLLLAKAGTRRALGEATVVALAGATGSGKSSLFNALAGTTLSPPGVRRPTTATAHAAVWGEVPEALLDWLEVPRRHHLPAGDTGGLVLLDLPDHDSTAVAHRLEVDRLVEVVDVLVWVLDPQKYADAAVHDRYLAPYASHAASLVVVLNQVDRLAEPAPVLADLTRLLQQEGLGAVPVLPLSATTGQGLPALQTVLRERVARRRAADERLLADARSVAHSLEVHAGGPVGAVSKADRTLLLDALGDAAGVPVVTAAVARGVRERARRSTSWPLLRWTARLRPDPLRRLHLESGAQARTSLPPTGRVEQARVDNALRSLRDHLSTDLPVAWRQALVTASDPQELAPALDRAVAGTPLGAERVPLWARALGLLQLLLLAAATAGGLWLLVEVGASLLLVDSLLPDVEVRGLPVPTVLLVLGLLTGALLGALARPLTALLGRRRARRARRGLLRAVAVVADRDLLAPLRERAATYEAYCSAVRRAAG